MFGPAGQGKTYELGTAAFDERTAPILILDYEGGTHTLKGIEKQPGYIGHEVATIKTWKDYEDAFDRLESNDEGFKSTGIDSLSETHIFALLTLLDEEKGRRRDPDALQQQDYGKAMIQLRRFIRGFRDLPMHVVFTATAKDHTDPREGLIKKPALSGQMSDEAIAMVDVAGYLALTENEEGETIRSLVLKNYPKIRTKVRTPWGVEVPDEIDNPTISTLLDTLGY